MAGFLKNPGGTWTAAGARRDVAELDREIDAIRASIERAAIAHTRSVVSDALGSIAAAE